MWTRTDVVRWLSSPPLLYFSGAAGTRSGAIAASWYGKIPLAVTGHTDVP